MFESNSSNSWNSIIISSSSIIAFSCLLYTINRKSQSSLQLLLKNPLEAAKHPKVAAYMFAGRAFGMATLLVGTASVASVFTVSYLLNVSSLKEFSQKMALLSQNHLHILKGNDSTSDPALEEHDYHVFVEACNQPEPQASAMNQLISAKVRGSPAN